MNILARERKFSTEGLFHATKQVLLEHGYEGFTFALLADLLDVSRGTLYKYYENKDELITDYMIYEMNQFLIDLKRIQEYPDFQSQFDYLIDIIFKDRSIPKIITMAQQIPAQSSDKVKANKAHLDKHHLNMYKHLQSFINLGREEKILKSNLADGLILGMIFQTIAIPNHFGVPQSEWVQSIKDIVGHGMFTNS